MTRVLGVNAVFHDPAAAVVVDGKGVAAAEEERFSRRKHGKPPVAFSTWELPEQAMAFCLAEAGIEPADLDAVAYSYDPDLTPPPDGDITAAGWENLRTLYVRRAPLFLRTSLPGLDPARVRWVAHHVAHAASATFASGFEECDVLVIDGRGERASHLAGRFGGGRLEVLAAQLLPHSLGLLYEDLTAHLGFRRSSDEYRVMALASYGEPAFLSELRSLVRTDGDGGFRVEPVDFARWAPPLAHLRTAGIPYERPADVAEVAAEALARNQVVAWFQGRSEYGPRALGHRSLLADPRDRANLGRLNDVKGREQFRPVAPMVLDERAAEIFDGPLPSPFMLFTHDVRDGWAGRIPAVVHVDGTARIQTVDRGQEPLVARMLERFEALTGVPVVVNTSLNTAGRPMVDDPRDALECFVSAPVDLLAIGPFAVRRVAA
jgi:predicted NodU family carbamoyl transferase